MIISAVMINLFQNVYGACQSDIYNEIKSARTPEVLQHVIKKWSNHQAGNQLTKECMFYIGNKYLSYYHDNWDKENVQKAKDYLQYALNNLKKYSSIYHQCKNAYNEAIFFEQNEDKIQQLQIYLNNPFSMPPPFSDISDIQAKNFQSDLIKRYIMVYELISPFHKELRKLESNQSYEQVKRIKIIIDRLAQQNVKCNSPVIDAILNLHQYYQISSTLRDATSDVQCKASDNAMNLLKQVKKVLPYIHDTQNLKCQQKLACLTIKVQAKMEELMPDHNQRNRFDENMMKCQQYMRQFHQFSNECDRNYKPDKTFQQLTLLNNFYDAYEDSPNNIKHLILFMKQIQHNQNHHIKELYALAGFYIAEYYYIKTTKLLFNGPDGTHDHALKELHEYINELRQYSNYIQMAHNVFKQYQLLQTFFDEYQVKPDKMVQVLAKLDEQTINEWDLKKLLRNAVINQEQTGIENKKEQETADLNQANEVPQNNQNIIFNEPSSNQNIGNEHMLNNQHNLIVQNKQAPEETGGNTNKPNPTITTFEKLARAMLQFSEPLTCGFIHKYDPAIEGKHDMDCFDQFNHKTLKAFETQEDRFRYYHAFASIRQAQQDLNNWVDNLVVAYGYIPDDLLYKKRRRMIEQEIAGAKQYALTHKKMLSEKVKEKLRSENLLDIWTHDEISIIPFHSPNEAVKRIMNIDCQEQDNENANTLMKRLIHSYHAEYNLEIKLQYTKLFIHFIENDRCIHNRKMWLEKFYR
jgi:hypothetical protein